MYSSTALKSARGRILKDQKSVKKACLSVANSFS
jgi:hypothetical protein